MKAAKCILLSTLFVFVSLLSLQAQVNLQSLQKKANSQVSKISKPDESKPEPAETNVQPDASTSGKTIFVSIARGSNSNNGSARWNIEIKSGISAGEKVVLTPENVTEGQRVDYDRG